MKCTFGVHFRRFFFSFFAILRGLLLRVREFLFGIIQLRVLFYSIFFVMAFFASHLYPTRLFTVAMDFHQKKIFVHEFADFHFIGSLV